MERSILMLIVAVILAITTLARGDHGVTVPRQVVEVPAIDSTTRLNELVDACSVGRPFPPLRTRTLDLTPPVGVNPPVVPTQPSPGTHTIASNGEATRGQSIYQTRCTDCHSKKNVTMKFSNVGSRIQDDSMPQGGPPLSAQDKADLLAWTTTQK